MTRKEATQLAYAFKALSSPVRVRILDMLADGSKCVKAIHKGLRLTQPHVSHHLAILLEAGLVTAKRYGQWVYYTAANPTFVRQSMEYLCGPQMGK